MAKITHFRGTISSVGGYAIGAPGSVTMVLDANSNLNVTSITATNATITTLDFALAESNVFTGGNVNVSAATITGTAVIATVTTGYLNVVSVTASNISFGTYTRTAWYKGGYIADATIVSVSLLTNDFAAISSGAQTSYTINALATETGCAGKVATVYLSSAAAASNASVYFGTGFGATSTITCGRTNVVNVTFINDGTKWQQIGIQNTGL
jgi:hypothetical protein